MEQNEITRAGLYEQIKAKLSDHYNVNINDIELDTRLIPTFRMSIFDLYSFRDIIEEDLGLIPLDESMVKFWREVEDIINSYIPLTNE